MPVEEQVVEHGKETGGEKGKGQPETVTIPKAEWERSQRESTERGEAARYWSDRARGNGKREIEIEPPPERPARSARDALWLEENNKPKPRPPGRSDR